MSDLFSATYNPDVLSCLANLSNDEVFTPPEVVNQMLDMLPEEIWSDKNATFLDPACKSGVFLREIARRLIEAQLPNYEQISYEINEKLRAGGELDGRDIAFQKMLESVIEHVFKNQVFGIAITELTSLLSRRSVYCSKYPQSEYSVMRFDNPEGNIDYKQMQHTWKNGKCVYCGASESEYDREEGKEQYAYEFIHLNNPEEVFDMKFDVIIGNPPYQFNVGNTGGNASKAKAIYHLFVDKAIALKPRYLVMITPSRWMTRTSEGIPDSWVDKMLKSQNIRMLEDFENSSMCFPGVEVKGGISYFLWDRDYAGDCEYIFHSAQSDCISSRSGSLDSTGTGVVVRDPRAYSILEKIQNIEGEDYVFRSSFANIVSPKDFFTTKETLTSNWSDYVNEKNNEHEIKYYLNKDHNRTYKWISVDSIKKHVSSIGLHKVYIPAAGGSGSDSIVLGKPFYGEPGSVCSQTYLVIGYDPQTPFLSKKECLNVISYIQTRFFRYLVSIKKKTQNGPRSVYQFVPLQDFSVSWTDEKLFEKYLFSKAEIDFINAQIEPMNLDD